VPNVRRSSLKKHVKEHIEQGAIVYTDALKSYEDLNDFDYYCHQVINHAEKYVDGSFTLTVSKTFGVF
jgi:transposase-like protein